MRGNSNRQAIVTALALTAVTALAAAAATHDGAAPPAAPGFERLKSLAGEWVSAEDGQFAKKGDLMARYVVTAGGTAVIETVFPGQAHEMVTVYHADGADVVLTHYCMGNQPRMRARGATGTRFEFAYDGGTNIDPGRDRHMHSAWLELVGPDEIRNEWTEHAAGKAAMVVKSHLLRKAR